MSSVFRAITNAIFEANRDYMEPVGIRGALQRGYSFILDEDNKKIRDEDYWPIATTY